MPDNYALNIRDPLYGFIGISEQEKKIIQTPHFQRLRRIKQLSNTFLVYPSAIHTRFEHSLGTVHLAGKVAAKLQFEEYDRRILRLCALLHDVGQGPFSHLFEVAMKWLNGEGYKHENTSLFLIKHDKEISNALGNDKDSVIDALKNRNSIIYKIISSDLDIDKMDYFLRDSYHAGVNYGIYDFHRILLTLCKISRFEEEYLGITEAGMRAVESFRLARLSLWEQVYEHHTRIAADLMFLKALHSFFSEDKSIKKRLTISNNSTNDFCEYFLSLDDESLQHQILNKSKGKAKEIVQRLRDRKLLKRAYRILLNSENIQDALNRNELVFMNEQKRRKKEIEISEKSGVPHENLALYIQTIPIKGYRAVDEISGVTESILVKMRNGDIRQIDEVSPLTLQWRTLRRLYVFGPPQRRELDKIKEVSEDLFGVKSDLINIEK